MNELLFALRFYSHGRFNEWLALVEGHGYRAGHELAELIGTPQGDKPGSPDNVYAAEKLLMAATAAGLIERQGHDPGLTLRFLGVGGRSIGRKPDQHSSAVEFGYVVGKRADLVRLLLTKGHLDPEDLRCTPQVEAPL